MNTGYEMKSTLEEIQKRFDQDVERFSSLETAQASTIDATLTMDLITQAAFKSTKNIRRVLDIGCGAGNNTLKLLQLKSPIDCDLNDLSLPMLTKASERIAAVNSGKVTIIHQDFRTADLANESYDVILAAAVLHHLRDDQDWESAFKKIFELTAPGGSVWITDLVSHEATTVQSMMWHRYGEYLTSLGGTEYQEKVFAYVEKEDSPRPVTYQIDLLRKVGFSKIDLLHKNSCFSAFGAIKDF